MPIPNDFTTILEAARVAYLKVCEEVRVSGARGTLAWKDNPSK